MEELTSSMINEALEEAMAEMEADQTEVEEEPQKRIYIEFESENVTERTNNIGQKFYNIKLPKGTVVYGKDCSGWHFTQTRMFPSKYRDGMLVAGFPRADWEITISHAYRLGDDQEWKRSVRRVHAADLQAALAFSRGEYKAQ